MKVTITAILTGFFSGLFVYSIIGWFFTRKIPEVIRYKVMCFISIAGGLVVIILLQIGFKD